MSRSPLDEGIAQERSKVEMLRRKQRAEEEEFQTKCTMADSMRHQFLLRAENSLRPRVLHPSTIERISPFHHFQKVNSKETIISAPPNPNDDFPDHQCIVIAFRSENKYRRTLFDKAIGRHFYNYQSWLVFDVRQIRNPTRDRSGKHSEDSQFSSYFERPVFVAYELRLDKSGDYFMRVYGAQPTGLRRITDENAFTSGHGFVTSDNFECLMRSVGQIYHSKFS